LGRHFTRECYKKRGRKWITERGEGRAGQKKTSNCRPIEESVAPGNHVGWEIRVREHNRWLKKQGRGNYSVGERRVGEK
jgi:hypothetical protein